MLECTNTFAPPLHASNNLTVEPLLQAVLSCDLRAVEKCIHQFENRIDDLLKIIEVLGRRFNTPEVRLSARKFSWKQRGYVRWGVVVEFNLIRTNRILLIPTESEFPSVVLDHPPGTVGTVSPDCPKLMMRQLGKVLALPTMFAPPPLTFQSQ